MRFSFRKRVKIAPGIYVNLGKKGVSSLSVGAKGATVNLKGKTGSSQPGHRSSNGLTYSEYMRAPKAIRAEYRASGGKVPAGVKVLKFCAWAAAIFWGLIILAVVMVKA